MRILKKILFSGGLSLALTILLAGFAFGQSNQTAANKSWNAFWKNFSTAVKNKDRKTFIALTVKDFQDAGGFNIEQWIDNTSWRELGNSVNRGTTDYSQDKEIMRITRDRGLIFVYDKENGWRFFGELVA